MQCDPIQGHGQGHEPLKVGNSAIFKGYLLLLLVLLLQNLYSAQIQACSSRKRSPIYNGGWQMTTDS